MNRRSFMKKVGGALVGLLALPSKKVSVTKVLSKEEIILLQKAAFPMYNHDPNIANIDSNSEWAKQRFDESIFDLPHKTRLEFNSGEISRTLQSRVDMSKYEGLMSNLRCFMGGAV